MYRGVNFTCQVRDYSYGTQSKFCNREHYDQQGVGNEFSDMENGRRHFLLSWKNRVPDKTSTNRKSFLET